MKIVYSFNKTGYEADCWTREIKAASDGRFEFIPFNHGAHVNPDLYPDAWSLNRLYQARHTGLLKLYAELDTVIKRTGAGALIVVNCPPYHPEFLRTLGVYRVLFSQDDPDATYKRNIPYLHAYQHVFFCDPVHSPDLDMEAKMRACGMVNADWVPISVMDYAFDPAQSET